MALYGWYEGEKVKDLVATARPEGDVRAAEGVVAAELSAREPSFGEPPLVLCSICGEERYAQYVYAGVCRKCSYEVEDPESLDASSEGEWGEALVAAELRPVREGSDVLLLAREQTYPLVLVGVGRPLDTTYILHALQVSGPIGDLLRQGYPFAAVVEAVKVMIAANQS